MRLEFILMTGVLFNIIMAVMFPTAIFGQDRFGTESNLDLKFTTYSWGDEEQYKNIRDSQITRQNNEQIAESARLGEETAQFVNPFGSSSGGFLDWIGVALDYIKGLLLFFVPFITIIWLLPGPLAYILGGLMTALYIFGIVKFVGGR